jgi:endonuclease YncB( thermonuclease family)
MENPGLIATLIGSVIVATALKWLGVAVFDVFFGSYRDKSGLKAWLLNYSEVLLVLIVAGSIWQYVDSNRVTWITHSFQAIGTRFGESVAESDLGDLLSDVVSDYAPDNSVSKPSSVDTSRTERAQRPEPDYSIAGRVLRVINGDTIVVSSKRQPITVRLHGIDAPEPDQPFGGEATDTLTELVWEESVRIEVKTKNRLGQIVGTVHVGATNVNEEMVCRGYAWWYRSNTKSPELRRCEGDARIAKLGIWAGDPVAPWEWRKGPRTVAVFPSGPCGSKRTCVEMVDCAEAVHYLKVCGLDRLDPDRDGVPCEALCR